MCSDQLNDQIRQFLDGSPHAVVGASTDRSKYGNKVLRAYQQSDRWVIPVNPRAECIEGLMSVSSLAEIPNHVHGISIVTPPHVTTHVVQSAISLGIKNIWMQPGAISEEAIHFCRHHDVNLIAGNACILVVLGYSES